MSRDRLQDPVLILVRSLDIGGAERQVTVLARTLAERGIPVLVGVFYAGGALEKDLEAAGVEVLQLGKRSRWDLLGPVLQLRRQVRARKIGTVLCFSPLANLASLGLLVGGRLARVVWGVRNSGGKFITHEFGSQVTRFSYWLEAKTSGFPDRVVSNSHAGRDGAISRGFPTEKIEVIPNGIVAEDWAFSPALRREMRTHWGVATEELVVGVVARFVPFKGHEDFLRGAVQVLKRFPRVRLLCAGTRSPVFRGELERLAEELNLGERLIWHLDPGSDLRAIYSGLDLLVSSSREGEGFSNVVTEALAADLPCVVTTSGDSPWIVGNQGVVVPTSAPEVLGREIGNFLAEGLPDRSLGRGRARVGSEFSVERLADRYLDLIGRLS